MRILLPLCLLLAGCLADAEAQNPPRPASYFDKQGSAAPHTGGVLMQACGPSGTYCATENLATDDDPLLFPWGAQVVVDCASTSIVCWGMLGEVDVGALSTTVGLRDDAGTNGAGSCIRVLASTYRSTVNLKENFDTSTAVGRRNGFCASSSPVRPCRTARDCNANGDGGTCTASSDGGIQGDGAFLYASAQCGWTNE